MTEENQVQEPEAEHEAPQQPKPGRRLREAREAKGLSREDVATQLRLQVRLIAALEEDNEAELPPSTFVSGYLRSYARLLELPEESVVTPVIAQSEAPLVATIANKGEATSRDWPTRLVTYLIIVAIIVSVAMWWLSQRDSNGVTQAEPEPEVIEEGGSVSLALPETPADETAPAEALMEPPAAAQTAEQSETVPVTPEEEVASPAEEADTPSAEPQESNPVPSEQGPPPLTEATPQSTLELRYEADSWTEVSDSADRQLAYGLIKAGEVLLLNGEAPFRVFLGYAPGVNVYYNGDLFDHSPFQRRDVARFRIGRAEHNHPGSR
jgi:cytoskeleton protein RodZ